MVLNAPSKTQEYPLIFSEEMTRANLENRKLQTRRPITKVKGYRHVTEFKQSDTPGYDFCFRRPDMCWCDYRRDELLTLSPHGQIGDRLWGRESWAVSNIYNGVPPRDIHPGAKVAYPATDSVRGLKIRPSIHMPRWASRLLLEITEVRIERVQEISESDAQAEGVARLFTEEQCETKGLGRPEEHGWFNYLWHGNPAAPEGLVHSWPYQYSNYNNAKDSFSSLWELTYGKGAWDRNDWVWVYNYKVLKNGTGG